MGSQIIATIRMRADRGWRPKPEALAVNGRRIRLHCPVVSKSCLYPGEYEWHVDLDAEPDWPRTAPCWFAEGDLCEVLEA